MDCKAKAEEFFETIVRRRKTLAKIPLNCSQGETGVLLYLTFIQDSVSSSELAENLDVSLPRIASILNSLESKKLVEKTADNVDKRKTVVHITEVGKELVLSKKREAINKITRIMEKLDEEDVNQYIRISKKIEKVMGEIED